MAKLIKQKYYNSKGQAKINNFMCNISKQVVYEAGFTGNEEIKVYAMNGRIIIEKEK